MSDRIVEISNMMQNSKNLERDMGEAMEMVKDLFRERYLSGIQKTAKEYHKNTIDNPPREVALCNVLKEFAPPEKQEMLSKLSDMLLMMNTAKSIHGKISIEKNSQRISAKNFNPNENLIHNDGIYELDQQCLNKSELPFAELMFLMALAKE